MPGLILPEMTPDRPYSKNNSGDPFFYLIVSLATERDRDRTLTKFVTVCG